MGTNVYGVVLAGGIGSRMGNVEKPKQWIKYTQDVVRRYIRQRSCVDVIEGGATRNETVMNSISHIEQHYGLDEETIIVTHDSVRPFVTHRILEDNIRFAKEFGACDTVIAATDTIVRSSDHEMIAEIPDRSQMYQGQTPQSFKAKKLREVYQGLTEEEKKILTDCCKIYVLKGEKVHLVEGEVFNMKITYPFDLRMAQSILGEEETC